MSKKTTCSRCIIDSTVPGANFDIEGACSYCRIHDALDKAYPTGEEGKIELQKIVDKIKRTRKAGSKYDCIVGFSGGTDSTYLLHLAKTYGLNPLAVHFDNGWNSKISSSNIKKCILALDIDLITYVVNWEEFKDILVSHLKASIPWADMPTDIGITSTLYKIAASEGIKHILVGNNFRTEGKQPTEWTYGDGRMVRSIQKRFGSKKLKTFPNLYLKDVVANAFFRRIKVIRPFYFMNYDKEAAKTFLETELNWEYYGGHHYESIFTRFIHSQLLPLKFKIDKRMISLSAEVRSGLRTRNEAIQALSTPPMSEEMYISDRQYVIKKLGISNEEFDNILQSPCKSVFDYPSYYKFIKKFTRLTRIIVKLFLPWTPMIFFEMDERSKAK